MSEYGSVDYALSAMERFFARDVTPEKRRALKAEVAEDKALAVLRRRLAESVKYWQPPTDYDGPTWEQKMASGQYGKLD